MKRKYIDMTLTLPGGEVYTLPPGELERFEAEYEAWLQSDSRHGEFVYDHNQKYVVCIRFDHIVARWCSKGVLSKRESTLLRPC